MKMFFFVFAAFVSQAAALTYVDLPEKIMSIDSLKKAKLQQTFAKNWKPAQLVEKPLEKYLIDLVGLALLNNESPDKCVAVVMQFCAVVKKRVAPDDLFKVIELSFNQNVTDNQLAAGAAALKSAQQKGLPSSLVGFILSHGIAKQWNEAKLTAAFRGLEQAKSSKVSLVKAALAIMAALDAAGGDASPAPVALQAVKGVDKTAGGVAPEIAYELYLSLRQATCKPEYVNDLLHGLVRALGQGLSANRMGVSLASRVQEASDTPPHGIIEEELISIRGMNEEARRLVVLSKKPGLLERINKPVPVQAAGPRMLDEDLLRTSLMEFHSSRTPFSWYGATLNGVDGGGLAYVCYTEQGLSIPRTSDEQLAWFKQQKKLADTSDLKFGDILFFTGNGVAPVVHAGVYYGSGRFLHATSTVGITFGDLNDPFFHTRISAAGRVGD